MLIELVIVGVNNIHRQTGLVFAGTGGPPSPVPPPAPHRPGTAPSPTTWPPPGKTAIPGSAESGRQSRPPGRFPSHQQWAIIRLSASTHRASTEYSLPSIWASSMAKSWGSGWLALTRRRFHSVPVCSPCWAVGFPASFQSMVTMVPRLHSPSPPNWVSETRPAS